ncbi:MAG: InlB B-repeat-containing protein [Oscillospiraceae bacterium]|nr:InlB B-repeat-containing protein [Oscillospiraceae bacterium]
MKRAVKKVLSITLAVCMALGFAIIPANGLQQGPYKIIFNGNGDDNWSLEMQKEHDVPMFLPTQMPQRDGFVFLGWALAAGATEPNYKIEDIQTAALRGVRLFTDNANITLYAVWRSITYTVTYNANGGTGIPIQQTKRQNEPLQLSGMKPTRVGFEFIGWGIAGNATVVSYQPSDYYFANASTTLFAMWRPLYTVTFNPNGGSVTPLTATTGMNGIYTLSTFPVPLRANHTFLGWFSAATGGTEVTAVTIFTTNTTIFAQWAGIYTVSFNVNGGTALNPSSAQTMTDGRLASLPVPTRVGYTFIGWFSAATGGTEVTANTVFSANTTIFARWTDGHTITFNPNGGTVTPTWTVTATSGKPESLPTPTRSGYSFAGWFTAATGGTEVTTDTIISADTVLFAQWSLFVRANSSVDSRAADIAEAAARDNGSVVTVVMAPGSTSISKEILAVIMGKDVILELDFGNNGRLEVNGRGIVGVDGSEDLNLSLQYLSSTNTMIPGYSIPKSAIDAISLPIHQVKVGIKSTEARGTLLTVHPGRNYAGMNALLCIYDAAAGRFEVISANEIDSYGSASVVLNKTGDYIIMIRHTGDVTGTGNVTANDALEILKAVTGRTTLSVIQTYVANSRRDGTITASDALDILKFVAGLSESI